MAGIADFDGKEIVKNNDGYEITMMTNYIGTLTLVFLSPISKSDLNSDQNKPIQIDKARLA